MKVIAVANQKGGCAKTTTVVNLAAGLALRDFSVLVIDLDSQANATNWLAGSVSTPGSWQMLTTREDLASLIVKANILAFPKHVKFTTKAALQRTFMTIFLV